MPRFRHLKFALGVGGFALLAACSAGKPTGQVAARVAGEEITAAELRLELSQMSAEDAGAQQRALQNLIVRKLLVREADKQNIDSSPEGVASSNRARELALVELLRGNLSTQHAPDTSEAAVSQYIATHPSQFSGRKLITADQLAVQTQDASLGAKLQALGDFAAVEAYLTRSNIPFVRSAAVLDTAALSPEAAQKVGSLQTSALYVGPPAGGAVRVMRIMSTQDAPLTGEDARNAALHLMAAARAQGVVDAMRQVVEKGKPKVWIDPAFASS